jgi:FkbM family methyltransferase
MEYMGFKMVIDPSQRHDLYFLILKDKNLVYEEEVVQFLRKSSEKNIIFVDIGANNGFFSLLVASLSQGNIVYSFEPSPSAYARLTNNIGLNSFKNIQPYNLALGSKEDDGYMNISNLEDGLNSLKVIPNSNSMVPVHITTLDNVLKVREVDIIKMDVEGMEEEVMKGAKEIIGYNHSIKIIFEHNATFLNEKSDNGVSFLTNLGFSIYRMGWDRSRLILRRVTDVRNLPDLCNLIAVRDEEFDCNWSAPL